MKVYPGFMEPFCILTVVTVTQIHKQAKTHRLHWVEHKAHLFPSHKLALLMFICIQLHSKQFY